MMDSLIVVKLTNRGLSGPTRTHNTGLMINSMKPDWHLLVNLHNYFFFSLVPNDLVLSETRVRLRNPCQLNFTGKVTEIDGPLSLLCAY